MTTDAQILAALREAGENGIAGTELSRRLGVSRAAIWARIDELRTVGFRIEASPHAGYRLFESPNRLFADDILSRLKQPRAIGRDIRVFRETKSTNDLIERMARDGAEEGIVVFAEKQTAGKGRLGRVWESPAEKGLWFSILLRPKLRPLEAGRLTIGFSNAIAQTLRREYQVDARIKWPNDIFVNGRKLCGILTEMSAEIDSLNHVALGIGINVNIDANDFPPELRSIATSLKIERRQEIDRPQLSAALLQGLEAAYPRIQGPSFRDVRREWAELCETIGQEVTVYCGQRTISGSAESIDEDGGLLIRGPYGALERVIGGDVTTKPQGGRART